MSENLKEIEDKFLVGCHSNNIACCRWWLNIPQILSELSTAKLTDNNIDLIKKLAIESIEIIKMFKNAIIDIEGIDINLESEFNYLEENKKLLEEKTQNINGMEYILYFIYYVIATIETFENKQILKTAQIYDESKYLFLIHKKHSIKRKI